VLVASTKQDCTDSVIGDLHEVQDIWEVQDANTVPGAFAAAYEDPESVWAAALLATIGDRGGPLARKTPYGP